MLALVWLAACRGRSAEAPSGPSIALSLDGAARTISIDRSTPLAALVAAPAASWIEVIAIAKDERWLELERPSETFPDGELRLYPERGRIALGVFPPVTADMPPAVAALARQPLASLGDLTRVDVLTRRDLKAAPLAFEIAGREVILPGEQLRSLRALSGGKSRPVGWPLGDVLALAAPGRAPARVRILGTGEITLDGAALRDPEAILVLKSNQRGEYVFRVWHKGERHPTREVRRVAKIVID